MNDDLLPEGLLVQIREIPGLRSIHMRYVGLRSGLNDATEALKRVAVIAGVGPCGPSIADFGELPGEGEDAALRADLFVPVRGIPGGDHPVVEIGPMRVASVHYSGVSGESFLRAHRDLFSWMDAQGHPRAGTRHLHVCLAGSASGGELSVELRVPLIGGGAPRPPM